MIKNILLLFSFSILSGYSSAQNFSIIDTLPTGAYGTAEWGDFDHDGFQDLVYISQVLPDAVCKIYHNQNNVFTEVSQQFPLLFNPDAKWADFDNDGFEDLIVCGLDSVLINQTFIYRSLGNGTFISVPHSIPGISIGSIDVADYNNDHLLDIAITGYRSLQGPVAYIFKNLGAFQFMDIGATLSGIQRGELSWADYNHDSLPDLVINGDISPGVRMKFYRNMGSDVFQEELFSFSGSAGTIDWIDYDLDGIDDIFISGSDSTFTQNVSALYRNDGSGNFTLIPTNIPEFGEPSAVDVADFNNDSIMDICLVGGNQIFNSYSIIAYGNGTPTFIIQPLPRAVIDNLFVDASDLDNDGDMDLIMSTYILLNDGITTEIHLSQQEKSKTTVYPNPTNSELYISSKEQAFSFELFDLQGKLIKKNIIQRGHTEISVSDMEEGIYSLKLIYPDGDSAIKKVCVIR